MNYYNAHIPPPPYVAPPPNPWRIPIRRNANAICACLLLLLLSGFLWDPLLTRICDAFVLKLGIHSPQMLSLADMLSDLAATVLRFVVPLFIMKLWIGIPEHAAFPMRRLRADIAVPAVFICLGASVAGRVAYGIIASFLESFFGISPYLPPYSNPVGIFATGVYFVRLAVVPAVLEELLFRGVIMQSLRRFGDWFALICSSMLFSLAHHNLVQGPNAMMMGVIIGFFVLRTGSLRTGILIHFVNNALAVLMDLFLSEMPARETGIMMTLVLGFYVISGLICLAFLILTRSGMFSLAPSSYPVEEKKKYSAFFLSAFAAVYVAVVTVLTCYLLR